MNYIIILVIIVVVVVFVDVVILLWFRRKAVNLSAQFVQYILRHITNNVKKLPHLQQIIEYDKILDNVLGELGFRGTLGEKMKQYQIKYPLAQSVWNAHRERNKIVHEVGYEPSHDELSRHILALEKEVTGILKRGH